ncbi:hypothetical protein CYLTODRAFT_34863 [Cylindrobasidium torrendii FP15055 ss-10]|uniref:BTB domain-containing protein n=1 Tax=Cylindrobasidium torrendii FP15055 ss-10 TaxID=1314674 RepID=A0A0D7BA21_9AGAR|nr:hypothetical protein CYLTODRAFT_34863 [Cylindrobasidium torrendii FP15055 ss-10]
MQNRQPVEESDSSKPLVPWFGSGNVTGSGLLGSLEDNPTTLEDENVLSTHPSIGRAGNATPDPHAAYPSTNSAGNPFGSAFSDLLGSARPPATVSHKGSGSPPGSLKSIGSAELNGPSGSAPIGSERERRSGNRTSVTFAPTPPLTPPADDGPVLIQSMQIKRSEPLRFFDPTDATASAVQQVPDHGQQFPSVQYSPNHQHFQPNYPPRLQSPTLQQQIQHTVWQQMNAPPNQQQQAFQVEVPERVMEMDRKEKPRSMGAQESQQKQLEAAQKEAREEFERAQREQFQQAMALFGFTGTQRMELPSLIGPPNPSQSVSPAPIPQLRGYRPSSSTLPHSPGMNTYNQQQPQSNAYGFVPQAPSFSSLTTSVVHESANPLSPAASNHGIARAPPTHPAHSMMGALPIPPVTTDQSSSPYNRGVSPDVPHHLSQHLGQLMHPSPTHRPSTSLPASQPQQVLSAHHTPSPSLQVQIHAEPSTVSQPVASSATRVVVPQLQRVSTPVSHSASARTPQIPASVGPVPASAQETKTSPVAMNQTAASFLLRALDTNPFDIEFVFYRRVEGNEDVKTKGMLASSAWLRGKSEWLDGVLENAFPDGNVIGWDYTQDNDKADGEGKGAAPISTEKTKDGATKKIVLRDVAYRTWKSFLAYLYTERLTFEPASALSMYRIAERAGIPRLRIMALKMLERYLCDCPGEMVVEMAFEVFSARYEEVLDVEVAVIKHRLREGPISGEGVKRKLQEKIGAAMGGELGHAELAVRKLVMAVF